MDDEHDSRQHHPPAGRPVHGAPALPPWHRRVLRRLALERHRGWYTLFNQLAPGAPAARPDVVLAGPSGVFAVLLRDREPRAETSRAAFVWTSELLAGLATPRGLLTESVLRTVIVVPGTPLHTSGSGEHLLVGEDEVARLLSTGDPVLAPAEALAVARHLHRRTAELTPVAWHAELVPAPRAPGQTGSCPDVAGEFRIDDLHDEHVDQPRTDSPRDWRVFLDHVQAGAVRRRYDGPARLAGPAGTGKSVLALHRLAYLARRTSGTLLFTSHVRTLPRLAARQFATLAPQVAHRVEFTDLHTWAERFLTKRRRAATVDPAGAEAAFDAAWERLGARGPLGSLRPSREFWKEEVDRVIKGRAIRTLGDYRSVHRKGRGEKLTPGLRAHVWEFYCEYERELSERGAYDHNDVLLHAIDELERQPLPHQYEAVVVDEVQDITLTGLRLAHAISGDGPNQLLLVGDGEQQVSAGGWRWSELNIPLRGRGETLRRNYRNRAALVDLARELDTTNRFDDLDGGMAITARASQAQLDGGRVVRWRGLRQEPALIEALRGLDDTSDVAVLTRTGAAAEHWRRALTEAGFEVTSLERWDGSSTTAILVGPVHQAKGAEFRAVFLPAERSAGLLHRDERERLRRQRLAAVTRARDHVWLGTFVGT